MPKYIMPHEVGDLVWIIDHNEDVVIGEIIAIPNEQSHIHAIKLVGKMKQPVAHISESLIWKFYDIKNTLSFSRNLREELLKDIASLR